MQEVTFTDLRQPLDGVRGDTRHHRLKGALGTVGGLEQWQYEVTAAGRIWYVVDLGKKTVWIRWAGTGHPKATD
jgi:hypothetical protein